VDILIIGGTGYLGSNFSLLCKELKIPHTILDLRHVKDNNLEKFDVVIDFSMINRRVVTWLKDDIEMFKHNHNLLLDKMLEFKQKFIRVSSIFDVRSFIRNDSYTNLSRQISKTVLNRISNSTVIYSHAVYGGYNSNSFIDLALVKSSTFQESIRDYIHIRDFGEVLLSYLSKYKQIDREIEFGTGKPYLTSDIIKAKDLGVFHQLTPINLNSSIFDSLSKKNLICSAIQPKEQNFSTIFLDNNLVQYFSKI
jgi:nucleoside-diphosphate-sugar epimerase